MKILKETLRASVIQDIKVVIVLTLMSVLPKQSIAVSMQHVQILRALTTATATKATMVTAKLVKKVNVTIDRVH